MNQFQEQISRRKALLAMGTIGLGLASMLTPSLPAYAAGSDPVLPGAEGIVNVKDYGAAGDGVQDDTTAIRSACNVLKDGDTLLFPGGRYKTQIKGPLFTITGKKVKVLGNKAQVLIADDGLQFMSCGSIEVRGLAIVRMTQSSWGKLATGISAVQCSDVVISGNEVSGFTDAVGITGPCTRVLVEHNKLHHLGEEGIVVRNQGEFVIIQANEISAHLGDGILIKSGKYITVSNNYLHHACVYGDADYAVISGGNTAAPRAGGGITSNCEGNVTYTESFVVENNRLDFTSYGVGPVGAKVVYITKNRFSNVISAAAIEVNGHVDLNPGLYPLSEYFIEGNHIENLLKPTPDIGICVRSGAAKVRRIIIANNFIMPHGSHQGIEADGDNIIVSGNIVSDYNIGIGLRNGAIAYANSIEDKWPGGNDGRAMVVQDNSQAIGNKITGTAYLSIRSMNSIVMGNIISYTGTFWAVFFVQGSEGNSVTDNLITSANEQYIAGDDKDYLDKNIVTQKYKKNTSVYRVQIGGLARGGTALRPSNIKEGRVAGMTYFDSDLKKNVTWDGSNWRDGAGTVC